MRFDEDNTKNDYFDGPDIPDKPEEKEEPKRPELKPEDPDYWEQPESEWEHLKPKPRKHFWWWVATGGVFLGFLLAMYLRWFSPYISEATQAGYVESIERRGTIFKTFEGVILPYRDLKDSTRVYKEDFKFSVKDPKMAVELKKALYSNKPVRVEYSRYKAAVPWRGDEKVVITRVDSVNPRDLLPPEYLPEVP